MLGRCTETVQWRRWKRRYNIRVLIKSVSGVFDFRKVTCLQGISINPVSIAEQIHITQSLLGTGIIASYPVLIELGNGDSGKDADDGNCNQHFYECETCRVLVGWML